MIDNNALDLSDVAASQNYGSQMVIDPVTGFLEYTGNRNFKIVRNGKIESAITGVGHVMGFSGQEKLIFLSEFEKCWPNMTVAAKKAGVCRRTVVRHITIDRVFAERVQDIIDLHVDNVESTMLEFSKLPKNYMDRITIARGYRPDMWDPAKRVIVQHESNLISTDSAKTKLGGLGDIIDGEVVNSQFDPDKPTTEIATPEI